MINGKWIEIWNKILSSCYFFCLMVVEIWNCSKHLKCIVVYVFSFLVGKDHISAQTHVTCGHTWKGNKKKQLSQGQRVTSDFLVSPLCYIYVTPTQKWRKKSIFWANMWGTSVCLRLAGLCRRSAGEGGKTEGDSLQRLLAAGWTDYCWHVLRQPARSPTSPAPFPLDGTTAIAKSYGNLETAEPKQITSKRLI